MQQSDAIFSPQITLLLQFGDHLLVDHDLLRTLMSTMIQLPLPNHLWADHCLDLTHHRHQGQLLGQAQGAALGKAQRQHYRRRELAHLGKRPDGVDALTVYAWSNQGRLADLAPVRARRMSVSPFTYYRGMPSLMLYDQAFESHSGLFSQICGDCHLMNFGGFASPERNLLFGINDFDETMVAPFEWDLKRLVTSLVIAARELGESDRTAQDAIAVLVQAYHEHMQDMTELSPLQIWYESIDAKELLAETENRRIRKKREKNLKSAHTRTTASVLPKLTARDGMTGRRHFVDEGLLLRHPTPCDPFASNVDAFFSRYRNSLKSDRQVLFDRYECTDVALKVVGVGSVGTRTAIALFEDGDRAPLILQMKEARASVLAPVLHTPEKHQGERVVHGQQLMQAASDIFLGFASHGKHHTPYYVRQLRDMKVSVDLEDMDRAYLLEYAKSCGMALAHAHGKAGNADVILAYIGQGEVFTEVMQRYAVAYADRNEQDYQQFIREIKSGHLAVADEDVL